MRHLVTFSLLVALVLSACKDNAGPVSTQSGVVTTSNQGAKKEARVVPASVLAPLIGTWECQVTAGMSKSEDRKPYEGRWFTLRGDQTFATGVYEKETNQGMYEYDGETLLLDLFFDAPELGVADQYKLHGVGVDDSSILIWMGNTPRNKKGMQLKMVKSDNPEIQ
ncbi:MAG: hypothetical protein HKN16_05940 [Saprospiraceae bacterium]|nr:hypothetical protein [Saprospiraceae bacterium]